MITERSPVCLRNLVLEKVEMKNYSPKIRHLVGCGILLIILTVSFIGFAGWSVYSLLNQVEKAAEVVLPEELKEPKILRGEGFLSKTEMFKLPKLTPLQLITKSISISDDKQREQFTRREAAKKFFNFSDLRVCESEIIAVGEFGGYIFDLNGNLQRELYFEPIESILKISWYEQKIYRDTLHNLRIVDLENDGKCEFISFSSTDGAAVFDNQGKTIWRYGERSFDDLWKDITEAERDNEIYVTKAAIADLDGDGKTEYIVSRRNDGIRAFNLNKNEIWFQSDEFPTANFKLVDIEGDGKTELLGFQGKSSVVRDKKTGNALKELEINYGNEILPAEKPKEKIRFFEINDNRLKVSDIDNKILSDAEAPLSEVKITPEKTSIPDYVKDRERIYQPQAVWVSLEKGAPKFLAIIGSFTGFPRANLYIYDTKGNLVYHELLAEDAETIAVLPKTDGTEQILIGGKDTIWKFTK